MSVGSRLLQNVQHFQNPCVSFAWVFGILSTTGVRNAFSMSLSTSAFFSHKEQLSLKPGTLCSAREPQISYVFWSVEAAKNMNLLLIWWMLRARSIYFKPFIYAAFMIYAEARQPCYSISLLQLFQAYCTLPSIFTQHILIVGYPWFRQTHHKM